MTRDFNDWVDVEGLTPTERERLERVHALLVAAGPPPELTAALERPPAQVIQFPLWRRRPMAAALAAAVAVAGAAFGGGYVVGHHGDMTVVRTAALQSSVGTQAFASLRIGERYESGNWPIEMTVRGLPAKPNSRDYYLLMLWSHGKPAGICGAFHVSPNGVTKLHFDVPYAIDKSTHWVVTAIEPGERYPGTVMMKTV
jgi:hypothetical protein